MPLFFLSSIFFTLFFFMIIILCCALGRFFPPFCLLLLRFFVLVCVRIFFSPSPSSSSSFVAFLCVSSLFFLPHLVRPVRPPPLLLAAGSAALAVVWPLPVTIAFRRLCQYSASTSPSLPSSPCVSPAVLVSGCLHLRRHSDRHRLFGRHRCSFFRTLLHPAILWPFRATLTNLVASVVIRPF